MEEDSWLFGRCDNCNDLYMANSMVILPRYNIVVCKNCFEEYYFLCSYCKEAHSFEEDFIIVKGKVYSKECWDKLKKEVLTHVFEDYVR